MSQTWQIFLEAPDSSTGDTLPLKDEDHHHLKNVIRRKPGEQINVICMPGNRRFLAEICSSIDGEKLAVKLVEELSGEQTETTVAKLCFALCKGKKNDLVCEKVTELGVQEIIFWQSQRSVAIGKSEQWVARMRKIAESAARQSKRSFIPEVSLITDLKSLLEQLESEKTLVCSLDSEAQTLASATANLTGVNIIIGPEGDFSEEEQKAFEQRGFKLVSIGTYPLRSETAAISVVAMINALTT